ncbi:toprim domain-containing protein [Weissella minor]|uniref:toprim domain-containing protein n=1 Tax=Weissella minor TaxID=1620 RepID=UPI003AF1E2A7
MTDQPSSAVLIDGVHTENKFAKQKVSLEEYLDYQGHEIHKPNSKGYSKIDDHDSLFVNLSEERFTWFARNKGGGIFQLMNELDGITDYDDQTQLLRNIREERSSEFKPREVKKVDRKAFDISNFKIERLSNQSKKYLTQERKIHPLLVDALSQSGFLVDEKKVFQNSDGKSFETSNLVYLWKDKYGVPVGADVQATKKSKSKANDKHQGFWKGILKDSPASEYGFSFKVGPKKAVPDKLVVVEAPVDAISHWQMNLRKQKQNKEQVAYLSLSGVKGSVLTQYIKQNYWSEDDKKFTLPKEIHFAVDNDEAGRGLVKQYGEMFENWQAFDAMEKFVDVPADLTVKDWNDQLRYGTTLEIKTVAYADVDDIPLFSIPKVLDKEKTKEHEETVTTPEDAPSQVINAPHQQDKNTTKGKEMNKETKVVDQALLMEDMRRNQKQPEMRI